MNYIPGFSNYLETTVPRYAVGGRVMDGEPMMYRNEPMFGDEYNMFGSEMMLPPTDQYAQPMMYGDPMAAAAPVMDTYQQAAVEPVTQEAAPAETAAPYDLSALAGLDLSGLNSLYGMNFGSDFGGGAMGGQYQADPNLQYIGAPLSNKGNATSQTGGNTFAVRADQPVRLVDHRTNQIVFEGTGFDAARKATELGQGLTDQFGRKANYSIQTADPTGNYSTVAYEKKNKSTLGTIADVAGTALPMAAMFIPGLQGLGAVAAGAGLGGAGAALKGDNILKGAVMGGLTSAGGALLSKPLGAAANLTSGTARALGTGIGATAGGLATGQNLQNSLLGGVLSGGLSYIAPDIQRGLGIGQGATPSTGSGASVDPNVMATVTGSNIISPSVSLGGAKAPATAKPAELEPPAAIVSGSGSPFAAAFPIPSNVLSMPQPTPKPAADQMSEEDLIKVTGERLGAVSPNVVIPTSDARGPLNSVVDGMDTATGEIVAEGNRFRAVTPNVAIPDSALSPEVLRAVNGPVEEPLIKVTGRQTTTPPVITGVETPLPDLSKTNAGAEAEKKKLGLEEYLRLAGLATGLLGNIGGKGGSDQTGTYTRGGGSLNPIFSAKLPSAGGLGTIGANRTVRPMGDVDWLTYGTRPELNFYDYAAQNNPAPVTTPIPNNPAGPIMEERDPMAMAKGGRTEFAVHGAGTGRSDDIPAVLSDGEYVIDAETVALLGDGSSKAGAKKLDDLRVKVRKHKGQKLAKGRFSANAKKPEAYLSGGRI